MNSSTVNAGDQGLASQYNNLRKDVIVQAGQYAVSTGSANAYLLSIDSQYVAYTVGDRVVFKANHTNTGSSTININSLGAKTLKDDKGDTLWNKSIESGAVIEAFYNGTDFIVTGGLSYTNYYYFGDGSDGDVTISTNTTLTRDMYYNNLTVNTGVELDPAGYAIYVKGTLTLTGTAKIVRNGNNGTAGTAGGNGTGGGGGTGGAALATGTCGANLGGANGGNGNAGVGTAGTAGTAVNPSYATTATASATGGTGGTGNAGAGGAGGANASATQGVLYNTVYSVTKLMTLLISPSRALSFQATSAYGALPSSGGGGGGSGDALAFRGGGGGGAGGNGGIIIVYSNIIAGTGTIEAKGGNGGNGGNGGTPAFTGGGGGGAGGNGGIVIQVYRSGTPSTTTLTGGTGGTGGSPGTSGTAGTNGGNGTAGQSILIQV